MTQDLKIPKHMHFIWLGGPMPDHLIDNLIRWRIHHLDWQFFTWSEDNLKWLENHTLFNRASSLVPKDAVYQFQADVARYEILYKYGGFYADADTRPLRPIDQALEGLEVFAAAEDRNWVGNTYLGAVPGHPLFHDLISGLSANVRRLRGKRPNHLSGPRYLTPIWRAHGGYVAPSHQFYPYSYTHVKTGNIPVNFPEDVVAVHQWNHTQEVMEARRAGA
jgi:mannosyltransferase OCH1-like enzyme